MGETKNFSDDHNTFDYPQSIIALAEEPSHSFRMEEFTNTALVTGACGDAMEFYLYVKDGVIERVSFFTDGCISTRACGSIVARLVKGKSIQEAMSLSPKMVLDELKGLPVQYSHCAILAVTTLFQAVADYLLH